MKKPKVAQFYEDISETCGEGAIYVVVQDDGDLFGLVCVHAPPNSPFFKGLVYGDWEENPKHIFDGDKRDFVRRPNPFK